MLAHFCPDRLNDEDFFARHRNSMAGLSGPRSMVCAVQPRSSHAYIAAHLLHHHRLFLGQVPSRLVDGRAISYTLLYACAKLSRRVAAATAGSRCRHSKWTCLCSEADLCCEEQINRSCKRALRRNETDGQIQCKVDD